MLIKILLSIVNKFDFLFYSEQSGFTFPFTVPLNGGASFRWSFGPISAWGSIESTTILTTLPSLYRDLQVRKLVTNWICLSIYLVQYVCSRHLSISPKWTTVLILILEWVVLDHLEIRSKSAWKPQTDIWTSLWHLNWTDLYRVKLNGIIDTAQNHVTFVTGSSMINYYRALSLFFQIMITWSTVDAVQVILYSHFTKKLFQLF